MLARRAKRSPQWQFLLQCGRIQRVREKERTKRRRADTAQAKLQHAASIAESSSSKHKGTAHASGRADLLAWRALLDNAGVSVSHSSWRTKSSDPARQSKSMLLRAFAAVFLGRARGALRLLLRSAKSRPSDALGGVARSGAPPRPPLGMAARYASAGPSERGCAHSPARPNWWCVGGSRWGVGRRPAASVRVCAPTRRRQQCGAAAFASGAAG